MSHRTAVRALTVFGVFATLAGIIVLGASPALADTDVVSFDSGAIHATPALGGRVVGHVIPGQHYTGQCWTTGDLVNDHGMSNRNWIRLTLSSGGTGYVSALHLKGNDKGNVPNHC
ncbi:MAG: hypothetical protein ACRDUW_01540 [Pseudonocardiaceae bacterium]